MKEFKYGDIREDGMMFVGYVLDKRDGTTRPMWNDPVSRRKRRLEYQRRSQANGKARDGRLKRVYGISGETFLSMIEAQNLQCPLCQQPLDINENNGRQKGRKPHVDHCHNTGVVRGVLCYKCNVGLGSFGDDIDTLTRAVEYLQKHKKEAPKSL